MKYIASTIVRQSDIGLNNNLFGGTLLRWLDEYGALFTYKYLNHKFVTYKMEKTYFLKSAKQGDCIDFYVTNLKFDKISINFDLVAKINGPNPKEIINTNMTFVAIDVEKERPQRLNPLLFELDEFEKIMNQTIEKYMSSDEHVFHNKNHIYEMINQLKMYRTSIPTRDFKYIYFALCYHDVVHIPGNINNEEKSIEILERDWKKVLSNDDIEIIKEMILSTKSSITKENICHIKYADLVHDLDMISFIDYETLKANDVKIRSEYENISLLEFYQYKIKYYDNLIKNGVFISTQYKKYNNVAIENIKKYKDEVNELMIKLVEAETNMTIEEIIK